MDWLSILDDDADEQKGQISLLPQQPTAEVSLLREYQERATQAILEKLTTHESTLLVMATGLGKTEIICEVIKRWTQGPILVLAHREELVEQLRARIELRTHLCPHIEQASSKAPPWAQCVVASINTIRSKKRLENWPEDYFSLIIVDEVHHYVGNTFVRPFERFKLAKRLGVTATPKRHDKKALGRWFASVAMTHDIMAGIISGFLAPIKAETVVIQEVNLKQVRVTAGDFVKSELDAEILKGVVPIVDDVMRHYKDEQAIVFLPGIQSAEATCERFNALEPGSACFIHSKTDPIERRRLVAEFKAGRFKRFCNCQIATEGFDAPSVGLIVLARPTRSLSLATQMVGRGTRVLPGLVDHLPRDDQAAERRALIAASSKPHVNILDFRGVCNPAMLQSPVDVLGGTFAEDEIKLAKKKLKAKPGTDVLEALEEARKAIHAKLHALESKTTTQHIALNLFDMCGVKQASVEYMDSKYGWKPMSPAQASALKRFGCSDNDIAGMSFRTASRMLKELSTRAVKRLATVKQVKWLARHGLVATNVLFTDASRAIAWGIAKLKRKEPFGAAQLTAVITGGNIPGEKPQPSATSVSLPQGLVPSAVHFPPNHITRRLGGALG